MVPSYGPLETILLSETFLFAGLNFWDILLSKLKWDTLYIYVHIYCDVAVPTRVHSLRKS